MELIENNYDMVQKSSIWSKNNTSSICPFKQSLEEQKHQFMSWSFISLKCVQISFPPNTQHKEMGYHSPNHHNFMHVVLAQPAS